MDRCNMDANKKDEHLESQPTQPKPVRRLPLDEVWPVHPTATWPEGLSLRRENIYEDRV